MLFMLLRKLQDKPLVINFYFMTDKNDHLLVDKKYSSPLKRIKSTATYYYKLNPMHYYDEAHPR